MEEYTLNMKCEHCHRDSYEILNVEIFNKKKRLCFSCAKNLALIIQWKGVYWLSTNFQIEYAKILEKQKTRGIYNVN